MKPYADCPLPDHYLHKTSEDCLRAMERDALERKQALVRAREGAEQQRMAV